MTQQTPEEALPIEWGIVADEDAIGYALHKPMSTVNSENSEKFEALQGLLTVLTKDHSDNDNTDNK